MAAADLVGREEPRILLVGFKGSQGLAVGREGGRSAACFQSLTVTVFSWGRNRGEPSEFLRSFLGFSNDGGSVWN